MAHVHSYARATTVTNIRRAHRLPEGSVPRVLVGQTVKTADTLAVAEVAREHRIIDLVEVLNVKAQRLARCLVKQAGDEVAEGEALAVKRGFLGLRRKRVLSPLDGWVVRIDGGQMLLEGERTRLEVQATAPGRVVEVEPGERVVIETTGGLLQLAWGRGGLAWGTLKVMDDEPKLVTEPARFNIDHRGAIVAIGSPLTEEFLRGAVDIRVKGIVAASARASLLPLLEKVDFPVGLTQGFGHLPMSARILRMLATYNGREIVLDTPGGRLDWRDKRPEVIIPLAQQQPVPAEEHLSALAYNVDQKVRILQAPYLGEIGTIAALPEGPRQLASGLWASGAIVETPSGESIFVPFANLEYLG